MFELIQSFVLQSRGQKKPMSNGQDVEGVTKLSFVNSFPARDRTFLTKIAGELNLVLTWDEYDEDDQNLAVLRIPSGDDSDDDGGEVGRSAIDRVLNKYQKTKILEDEGDSEERYEAALKARMDNWKREYYKVSFPCVTPLTIFPLPRPSTGIDNFSP
jgi:5'-3' exoribonuclease 1